MHETIGQKANTSDTYTKVQTATLLDAEAYDWFPDVYAKVQIEQKLAGTAQLDDVLNLLQLTEITGGHMVDSTGEASTTYVSDLAATLASQINTKANHNFVETSLTALQTNIDAKQDAFEIQSPLLWVFDPLNPLNSRRL